MEQKPQGRIYDWRDKDRDESVWALRSIEEDEHGQEHNMITIFTRINMHMQEFYFSDELLGAMMQSDSNMTCDEDVVSFMAPQCLEILRNNLQNLS